MTLERHKGSFVTKYGLYPFDDSPIGPDVYVVVDVGVDDSGLWVVLLDADVQEPTYHIRDCQLTTYATDGIVERLHRDIKDAMLELEIEKLVKL